VGSRLKKERDSKELRRVLALEGVVGERDESLNRTTGDSREGGTGCSPYGLISRDRGGGKKRGRFNIFGRIYQEGGAEVQ